MLDNLQVVYIDNYLGQSATVRDRLGKPDLPVLTVEDDDITVVETQEGVNNSVNAIREQCRVCRFIGMDVEWAVMGKVAVHDKVSVLQLCIGDHVYIYRLSCLGEVDLQNLINMGKPQDDIGAIGVCMCDLCVL